jgi:prefoldin alpha subunit
MAEKEELQKKIIAYIILEARLNGLLEKRKTLISKIAKIETTKSSMDEIKAGVDILVPIGAEAHIFEKIVDDTKFIVEVGAGIALEKSLEESKELLEKRSQEMKNILAEVEKSIAETLASLEKLGPEIEELVKS